MTTYNDDWEIISGYDESGGQGNVKKVRHRVNGDYGALKCLLGIHQNNSERRARFSREVEILRNLMIDGVSELLQDNAELVNVKNSELYCISRWIDGTTLTNHVGSNDLSIDDAIGIIAQLCDLIQKCHSKGVCHRDIKPDNIMVDNNGNIFLVDFGISYKENLTDFKTKLGQELGNRFFRIPDYSAGSERKDPRSDITMIVGILFFLISKQAPRVLIDKQMRPPHIALENSIPMSIKSSSYWSKLLRIFEIGFQPSVDLRFQKIEELKAMCLDIFEQEVIKASGIKSELEKFNRIFSSAVADSWLRFESQILELSNRLEHRLEGIADENGLESRHNSGFSFITIPGKKVEFTYALVRKGLWEPSAQIWHYIELIEPNRSYMEASYKLDGLDMKTYYKCLTADLNSYSEKIEEFAEQIFTEALKSLNNKLQDLIK